MTVLTRNSLPDLRSHRVEPLAVDSPTAVGILAFAGPNDDEIAVGVHRHRGFRLIAGGVGVHQRLVGQGIAVLVVEPHVDVGRAIAGVLQPNNGELALVVAGDGTGVGGISVDVQAGRESSSARRRSSG